MPRRKGELAGSPTSRDLEILATIKQLMTNLGRYPTWKELSHELGVCRSSIHKNLARLEVNGRLERTVVGILPYVLPPQ